MGLLGQLMTATTAAAVAFREAYFASDPSARARAGGWGDPAARFGRYDVYWAMYSNDLYRRVHRFSDTYKSQYGLYRHTRGCYNPAARIISFSQSHVFGGALDHEAGDGHGRPSALPIAGADDRLRKAIARLWWDSNWQVKKGVFTLWGATFGDVALRVCDDPVYQGVSLEVVHPKSIEWLGYGPRGDLYAYKLSERRPDPRNPSPARDLNATPSVREVQFVETAELDGDRVVYRTYLDNTPYDWRTDGNGVPFGTGAGANPEWEAPYGFIPFFPVKHIDIGDDWGMSELEVGRAKIDEVNDLGSKLHDQIRRMVEGAWLISGMPAPKASQLSASLAASRAEPSAERPEPGRTEMKLIYTDNPAAQPHSLVGPLDVAATAAEIRQCLDNLEDDYPELRFERLRTGGEISGAAIRIARQPAAAKIGERRPAYDYALTQAQMAAVAIGGWRGYDGYQGYGLDSYSAAKPTHRIDDRPVFAVEPMDQIEEAAAKFAALKVATDAGVPLGRAMADLGWSEADVKQTLADKAAQDRAAMESIRQQQALAMADTQPTGAFGQ